MNAFYQIFGAAEIINSPDRRLFLLGKSVHVHLPGVPAAGSGALKQISVSNISTISPHRSDAFSEELCTVLMLALFYMSSDDSFEKLEAGLLA
jgi:hypothetical protein